MMLGSTYQFPYNSYSSSSSSRPINPIILNGAIGRLFSFVYTAHFLNWHGDSLHAYLTPIVYSSTHDFTVTLYSSESEGCIGAGIHLESDPSHLDWLFLEQQTWNQSILLTVISY